MHCCRNGLHTACTCAEFLTSHGPQHRKQTTRPRAKCTAWSHLSTLQRKACRNSSKANKRLTTDNQGHHHTRQLHDLPIPGLRPQVCTHPLPLCHQQGRRHHRQRGRRLSRPQHSTGSSLPGRWNSRQEPLQLPRRRPHVNIAAPQTQRRQHDSRGMQWASCCAPGTAVSRQGPAQSPPPPHTAIRPCGRPNKPK